MTGKDLDWREIFKINFGAYVQVQEDRNMKNTLEDKTEKAIWLGTTENLHGTYILLSLCSGKKSLAKN